ncbi:hypothetical protein B0J11DRAFT_577137 [Dendryphion nanum]|uniref:Uncharacterized protein n=1 Tax=Dendryphion nanum TaxID=256645 RepID=A0A9P9E782_9PLEO|nr:hypothetical protein B0J11DRAFT_577137 [Dendryphion nanum]
MGLRQLAGKIRTFQLSNLKFDAFSMPVRTTSGKSTSSTSPTTSASTPNSSPPSSVDTNIKDCLDTVRPPSPSVTTVFQLSALEFGHDDLFFTLSELSAPARLENTQTPSTRPERSLNKNKEHRIYEIQEYDHNNPPNVYCVAGFYIPKAPEFEETFEFNLEWIRLNKQSTFRRLDPGIDESRAIDCACIMIDMRYRKYSKGLKNDGVHIIKTHVYLGRSEISLFNVACFDLGGLGFYYKGTVSFKQKRELVNLQHFYDDCPRWNLGVGVHQGPLVPEVIPMEEHEDLLDFIDVDAQKNSRWRG